MALTALEGHSATDLFRPLKYSQSLQRQTLLKPALGRMILPHRQRPAQLVKHGDDVWHDADKQQRRDQREQLFPRSIVEMRKERFKEKDGRQERPESGPTRRQHGHGRAHLGLSDQKLRIPRRGAERLLFRH